MGCGRNNAAGSPNCVTESLTDSAQVSWNTCPWSSELPCTRSDYPEASMLKEAQGQPVERTYGEWGAWPSSQEPPGSHSSSGPGYRVSEMSHSPSATPAPCPNCRFLRHLLHQKKENAVLRYHLLGFSCGAVRGNRATPLPAPSHASHCEQWAEFFEFAFGVSLFILWKCRVSVEAQRFFLS